MKNNILKKAVAISLLGTIGLYTMPVFANTKDEKVYSKINNNGEKYETIVSTKLSNNSSSELLEDVSELINIKNTNGDETFEKVDNKLIWKTSGKEIQYQGETDKKLPVTATIRYKLNGEEKTAEEIVGQKGRVQIKINYTNNDAHTVKVNGRYVRMYTPFIVVAGTLIDYDKCSNVQITNGKVLDNGNKMIAIGVCMPGLAESLDLPSSTIEIPTSITIEMDTEDFEMNSIISYSTAKMLDEKDVNIFNKLDDIYNKVNTLSNASTQLVDGTNKLKDGSIELSNGANTLKSGMHSALEGAQLITSKVSESSKTLKEDKSAALTAQMIESIGNTASKSAVAGIKQTESTIKKTAGAGIDANKEEIYNQAVASAKQIAEQTALATAASVKKEVVTAATQKATQNITTAVDTATTSTAAAMYYTTKFGTATPTQEQLATLTQVDQATINAVASAVKTKVMQGINAQLAANPTSTDLTEEEKAKIIAAADAGIDAQKEQIGSKMLASSKQIAEQTATKTALSVAEQVGNSVGQNVAENVANQVKTQALSKVAESMEELAAGLGQLGDGLEQLDNGTAALSDGTNTLKDGAETLADGITKFNTEGIQKVVSYVNGDLKNLEGRVKALKDLANQYNSFAGIREGDKGSVTFITIFDSLKKENFEKEEQNKSNSTDTNQTVSEDKNKNSSSKKETSSN